jgi:DNA helicase-2/ATP-dependent DNA helicase PcrA
MSGNGKLIPASTNGAAPPIWCRDLVELLSNHPSALEILPVKGLYLIDEWHDINAAEFRLLQLLLRGNKLVAVGDRYQIINSARGADIVYSTAGFEMAFPNAQYLPLGKSYRFGSSLSKLAQRLTARKCASHEDLYTEIKRLTYDPTLSGDCAAKVTQQVQALVKARADTRYSDIAIIVREPDQTIEIENLLLDQNIPYYCDDIESYLHRPEILMLRGLLHMASNSFATLQGDKESIKRMVMGFSLYLPVGESSRKLGAWLLCRRHLVRGSATDDCGTAERAQGFFRSGTLQTA